ncbi:MAG: tripartite tricarboxylate transporter substrate-binding protein [Gammaproteobacteria bacterium]|nr:tripartite tricarboxylate transporter substrate-binding protein [Gammaproteobacteria bacterium]
MKIKHVFLGLVCAAAISNTTYAAEDTLPDTMEKPGGFPERPLTMIVPYGPGGGSGQVAAAMAAAVTELTGEAITRDHKPGGSGMVGLTAYMAYPADGYTIVEHIDDATSAFASGSSDVNPAENLIPLVTSQITFSQIFIRSDEDRYTDWESFVAWAKDNEGTIANVSREGSMERVMLQSVMDQVGISLQQISFDKGGPRYGALKGGQVDALFEQPGDVKGFLDSGDFKPILTLLNDRPEAFADVPSMKDVGLDIEPLFRYRGFYVVKGVPEDRLAWLQWAFQKAFFQQSYQDYNESKFMNVIDSFRDTAGSIELINKTADIYRERYKEMGITP